MTTYNLYMNNYSFIFDENNNPIFYENNYSILFDLTDYYELGFNNVLNENLVYYPIENVSNIGFNNILSNNFIFEVMLIEDVVFNNLVTLNDFILIWFGRTKVLRLGYGGTGYGANFNYGEGDLIDIVKYYVKVIRTIDGVVLQTKEIIVDPDNSQGIYVYSYTQNMIDNGSFITALTFEVFQIDKNGNYSLVKSISYS